MRFNKILKKEFWKLYLIEVICFGLSFLLLFFSLKKVNEYMVFIKQYDLNSILVGVEDVNATELTSLLNVAGDLTTRIIWLFVLIPIGLFIIYNIFQALSWSRIRNLKYKKYLLNFVILNVIFIVIIFLLTLSGIGIGADIIMFILIYFFLVAYAVVDKKLFKDLKRAFIIGFKRFYPLFLAYLIFIIVNIILLIVYTIYSGYRSLIFSIIFALVLLAIFVLFKVSFFRILKKFS